MKSIYSKAKLVFMMLSQKYPNLRMGYNERNFIIPGSNELLYVQKEKTFKIPVVYFKSENEKHDKIIDHAIKDLEKMSPYLILTSVEYCQ